MKTISNQIVTTNLLLEVLHTAYYRQVVMSPLQHFNHLNKPECVTPHYM